MKTSQDYIHWLEQGGGALWLRRAAWILGALVLTVVFAWKQFHGPPNEWTMQQVELGRQLSRGQGFTTLVNYPQVYAVEKARGVPFDEAHPYPELYHAPLYPLLLAGVFAVLPDRIWDHVPEPPGGWAPDYAVLVVNLVLFWLTVLLVRGLARRLFDERAAFLAGAATAVSVSLLQQTVALSGLPLLMVLALTAFHLLSAIEEHLEDGTMTRRRFLLLAAALGAVAGLLFLTEYSAGLAGLCFAAYLVWRLPSASRWPVLGIYAGVAVLLIAPWAGRNMAVSGHPLGLAWQNLALKADDTTAMPSAFRNTATVDGPGLDLKKLGNKGLTGMKTNLEQRLWSGGGMLLTAFFIAGLAYQFRHAPANRLRWLFAGLLLVLLTVQPFLGSGESPRLPAYYLAPLLIVFGAGFFHVLLDSQPDLARAGVWVVAGLLALQAFPLLRDLSEPRKVHFYYPPYYPNLFMELRRDCRTKFLPGMGLATDVPAGTAWYGRMRVWAKPERLHDFYLITIDQNIAALLLTPVTLDRPFFAELAARRDDQIQLNDSGGWGGVYTGLVTRRLPPNFPLSLPPQRVTDNMVLLVNPAGLRR